MSFTRTFSFGAMKVRCGISQFFKRDDAYWTQEFVVIEHDKEVRVALNIVREGTPAPIKWFIDPSPYRVITGTGDGEADMAPAGAVFLMIVPDTGSAPLFTAQDGVFLPSDYTQRKK